MSASAIEGARALIGIERPARAAEVALALGDVGVLTTMAFTAEHFEYAATADAYRVAISDRAFDARATLLAKVAQLIPVTVHLGDWRSAAGSPVLETLPDATNGSAIVERVCRLFAAWRPAAPHETYEIGKLRLDPARREALWHGRRLPCSPIEFRLLTALARADGAVVTSRELQRQLWRELVPDDNDRLASHIRRLRRKFEECTDAPHVLLTVRGEGFRLGVPR